MQENCSRWVLYFAALQYNEVESGKEVSNERLLQYVIDRLDSLEKNINVKMQNKPERSSQGTSEMPVHLEFIKDKPFEQSEIDEVIDIFILYSVKCLSVKENKNILEVSCIINNMDWLDLYHDLQKQIISKKKIYLHTTVDN